ncbi:MAG TPA: uracil-DNA glycosylase [Terriglobia bacterium]|nr:uracil-DNA glycosylase [Terriglobia bacterium]
MNDDVRKELTAWLEFYQELGIEGFYRRVPGAVETPPSLEAGRTAQPAVALPSKQTPSAVPPRAASPPALPKSVAPSKPAAPIAPPPAVIRPPVSSFSLFEATPAPRSGPETLEQIRQDLGDCHRCKLAPTRKTIVFGDGNPHAELVFIGEGPGADEDEQGIPFVGRAGKLLNRMMQTVGLKREDVYICNVVKCRPPGNRTPEKDEVDACSPFLYRQIEAIKPRLVCCLGAPAVRTVLGIKEGITKIRGQFYNFGSAKALATVHPAYVLRNPREEKILREDFEKIRDFLKGA